MRTSPADTDTSPAARAAVLTQPATRRAAAAGPWRADPSWASRAADRLGAEAVYTSIHDDEAFARLPTAIARAVGARSAMILWRHSDRVCEALAWSRHARPYMDIYAAKYAAIDPWVIAAIGERAFDEVVRMEDHIPPSVFEQSLFCREFLAAHGDDAVHRAGVVVRTPWGEGLVIVERGRRAPAFEASDLAPLGEGYALLRRLLLARGEEAALRRGPKVARDDLDPLVMGSVVVGGDGHIVQVNLAADRVLRRADGLHDADNRLVCADRRSAAALDAAIAAATRPRGDRDKLVEVERGGGRLAYLVSVAPMPGPSGRGRARLVFIDPDAAGGRTTIAARRSPSRPVTARSPRRARPGTSRLLESLGALFSSLAV